MFVSGEAANVCGVIVSAVSIGGGDVSVAAVAAGYELYDTRTLKRTVRRGEVLCGVNKGLPGFSIPDDQGNWTGFDVDFCRAVAAAIFDDPKKGEIHSAGRQ